MYVFDILKHKFTVFASNLLSTLSLRIQIGKSSRTNKKFQGHSYRTEYMYLVVINSLQTNGGLFAWDNPPDFSIPFSILCIDLAIGGESFVIHLFLKTWWNKRVMYS